MIGLAMIGLANGVAVVVGEAGHAAPLPPPGMPGIGGQVVQWPLAL
jgi:hypothetical protein